MRAAPLLSSPLPPMPGWRSFGSGRRGCQQQEYTVAALTAVLCHHRYVTSIDSLARTAYEAHRGAHPGSLPSWEETPEPEQRAWKAAVSAVAGQTGVTLTEGVPTQSLVIQSGDQQHTFHTNFTVGRLGTLTITDDFASGQHARFRIAHGLWYVEDLGLNQRHLAQWTPHPRRPAAEERRQDQDRSRPHDCHLNVDTALAAVVEGSAATRPLISVAPPVAGGTGAG